MKEKLLFTTGPNNMLRSRHFIAFPYVNFYSILVNFHANTITNRNQMNIPNDCKTFLSDSIHELGYYKRINTH